MKRFISFLLIICMLCPLSGAFAADLGDTLEQQIEEMLEKYHAKDMLGDIKDLLKDAKNYSDEELKERIQDMAEARGVDLSDAQIDQIVKLCRTLDKGQELKSDLENGKEKVSGFLQGFRSFAQRASSFFLKLSNLFGKLEKI